MRNSSKSILHWIKVILLTVCINRFVWTGRGIKSITLQTFWYCMCCIDTLNSLERPCTINYLWLFSWIWSDKKIKEIENKILHFRNRAMNFGTVVSYHSCMNWKNSVMPERCIFLTVTRPDSCNLSHCCLLQYLLPYSDVCNKSSLIVMHAVRADDRKNGYINLIFSP